MTPLETIRAINAACDKAHIDSDPAPLFAGKLYRTKWGKGQLTTLWYIGNGAYKFRGKTMLEARGELTKFLLGDDSAIAQDVTAGLLVYLLSWWRKVNLIAQRADAAKERRSVKDKARYAEQKALSYAEWAENQLTGQTDSEGEAA
jgi:hypothetical protein